VRGAFGDERAKPAPRGPIDRFPLARSTGFWRFFSGQPREVQRCTTSLLSSLTALSTRWPARDRRKPCQRTEGRPCLRAARLGRPQWLLLASPARSALTEDPRRDAARRSTAAFFRAQRFPARAIRILYELIDRGGPRGAGACAIDTAIWYIKEGLVGRREMPFPSWNMKRALPDPMSQTFKLRK